MDVNDAIRRRRRRREIERAFARPVVARSVMLDDDDEIDVERFVDVARERLRALYSIDYVCANARSSARECACECAWECGNGMTWPSACECECHACERALETIARGLFPDDVASERASASAVKLALCACERGGEDGARRYAAYEYGAQWLERVETTLARVRAQYGLRGVEEGVLGSDCDFATPEGYGEDDGAWMAFERACAAIRGRRAPAMRDGFVFVPRELFAEIYAEHVGRCLREDLAATFRRLQQMVGEGRAPPAFDPNASYNALRAIRTWVPDVSELPKIPVPAMTSWGKRRRERRRANGVAQHAVAIEDDANATAAGASYSPVVGEDAKRVLKMVDRHVSAVNARPFPPCMRGKFEEIQRRGHLYFTDRFQLNLFLKGIGLNVNETINFWRQGVFPKGKMKNYQGEHTYNIRHNYGLEGAMIDYTPHECEKMQTEYKNGAGHCSCPFAADIDTFRRNVLGQRWYQSVSLAARDRVENAVHLNNPSAACELVFEDAHGGVPIGPKFEYPDAYFDASMDIEETYRERTIRAQFDRRTAAPSQDSITAEDVQDRSVDPIPNALPERFALALEDSSDDD